MLYLTYLFNKTSFQIHLSNSCTCPSNKPRYGFALEDVLVPIFMDLRKLSTEAHLALSDET